MLSVAVLLPISESGMGYNKSQIELEIIFSFIEEWYEETHSLVLNVVSVRIPRRFLPAR